MMLSAVHLNSNWMPQLNFQLSWQLTGTNHLSFAEKVWVRQVTEVTWILYPHTQPLDTPPLDTPPPGYPTPWILYPMDILPHGYPTSLKGHGTRDTLPPLPPVNRMTDRCLWKHCLPKITVVDGNSSLTQAQKHSNIMGIVTAKQVIWVQSLIKSLNFVIFCWTRLIRRELWKNSTSHRTSHTRDAKE